jgi:hypothetical protein
MTGRWPHHVEKPRFRATAMDLTHEMDLAEQFAIKDGLRRQPGEFSGRRQ